MPVSADSCQVESRHTGHGELAEGAGHPAKLRFGAGGVLGAGGDGQAKMDLEEVAAQLVRGGLEVVLAVIPFRNACSDSRRTGWRLRRTNS